MRSSCLQLWSLAHIFVACAADDLIPRAQSDLCTIKDHRAALVGSRYYFQGGAYTFQNGDTNSAEQQLYWLDLNTSFPVQGLLSANALRSAQSTGEDQYKGSGAFLTDAAQTGLYIFGGQGIGSNKGSMPTYNASTNTWSRQSVNGGDLNSAQLDGESYTYSADTGQGLNYVLGGLESFNSPSRGMLKLDSSDPSNLKWSKETGGDVPGFNLAGLEYIRAGKSGVLIAWGGYNTINWGAKDKWPWNYRPMDNIAVYDIESSTWYNVTATGDIPSTRASFCSAVNTAPDDSSINVHMYGGMNLGGNITYQDLYILSIPSFRWIKKVNAGDQGGAKGAQVATAVNYKAMTCAMYKDRQMIILGGIYDDPITKWDNKVCNASYPAIKVLDTTTYQWVKQFNASLQKYSVPHTIFDVVGGNTGGGATITTPAGGFNDSALDKIFKQRVPRYTAPPVALPPSSITQGSETSSSSLSTSSHSSSSSPSSSSNTGAIAGGVVGGVVAIAAVAGLAFWLLRSRRRKRQGWAAQPPVEKAAEQDSDIKESPTYDVLGTQEMPAEREPMAQELSADNSYKQEPRELEGYIAAELPSEQKQESNSK